MIARRFIDDYIPNENVKMIATLGALLVGLYILRMTCNYIVNYYGHVMGTRIERDMRIDLFKKIQTLDSDYFDDHKTGSIMSHIVGHLRDISEMSHHVPENVLVSTIYIIISFSILFTIHPLDFNLGGHSLASFKIQNHLPGYGTQCLCSICGEYPFCSLSLVWVSSFL